MQGRDDQGSQSGPTAVKRKSGATGSTPTTVAKAVRGGNGSSNSWSDDPDSVPAQLKREGADWFAMYEKCGVLEY